MKRLSVVLLAVAGMAALPAPSGAAKGPKPAIAGVSVMDPTPTPGSRLTVVAMVRNRGRVMTKPSVIRFFLSTDARRDRKDKPLSGRLRVGKLSRGKSKRLQGTLRLPSSAKPGGYRLFACVDGVACTRSPVPVGVLARARPVNVTPTLDSAAQDSGFVPASGGSVYALASDGTTYQLVIPSGALTHARRITMTPLSGVSGIPGGGRLVGGVRLSPEGLEFAKPATLIISRDGLKPDPHFVPFSDDGGKDLHLEPDYRKPPSYPGYDPNKSVEMPVSHFSDWGEASLDDLQTAAAALREPTEARDRLAQQMEETIKPEHDCVVAGGAAGCSGKNLNDEFDKNLDEFLDQVVLPEAQAASVNDVIYEQAVKDFISWMRQVELTGSGDAKAKNAAKLKQIEKLLHQAFKAYFKRAKEACDKGDLTQLSKLLGIERTLLLAGEPSSVPIVQKAFADCAQFELRFKSRLESHGHVDVGNYDELYALESVVPLTLGADGMLSGSAPLTYTTSQETANSHIDIGYAQVDRHESATGQTHPGELTVSDGSVDIGLGEKSDLGPKAHPPLVNDITIDPGQPEEEYQYDDEGTSFGGPYSNSGTEYRSQWLQYWRYEPGFHRPDSTQEHETDGPWLIDGFVPGDSVGSIGKRDFNFFSGEGANYTRLNETLEVVHVPKKG